MFTCDNLETRNSYISSNYVTSWKLKEGVREIVQNLMDAVTLYTISLGGHKEDITIRVKNGRVPNQKFRDYEFIFKGKVIGLIEYDHILRILRCTNPGTIPIEALLLGGTKKNKMESLEVIGRFGEGMKLAALALLREKKTFIIKTGGQLWTFFLKEDSTFQQECLHFSIIQSQRVEEATTSITVVEIGNLSIEEWNENIKHFLDLTDETLSSVPGRKKEMGAVLLGTNLRGRLFVKGIHVQDLKDELKYGYNIIDINLDRDRRCIPNVWDRYRRTSELLADVLNNHEENKRTYPGAIEALNNMLFEVYDMLAEGHFDVYYFHEYVSPDLANKLFEIFRSKLHAAGKNIEAMPLRVEFVNKVENQMRNQHITSSIYPYEICHWQLYYSLIKSTLYYRTWQQRINHYLHNTPIYEPTKFEQEIVNRVVTRIRLIKPAFVAEQIIFKNISYQLFFAANSKIYLSQELLNQDQVVRHDREWLASYEHSRECKIFAICTELLGIPPLAVLTHNVTFF